MKEMNILGIRFLLNSGKSDLTQTEYVDIKTFKQINPKFSLSYYFISQDESQDERAKISQDESKDEGVKAVVSEKIDSKIISGLNPFEGDIQFPSEYIPDKGEVKSSMYIDLNPLYESKEFIEFIKKYEFLLGKSYKYQVLLSIKTGSSSRIRSTFTNISIDPIFKKSILYSDNMMIEDEVTITISDSKLDPIKVENIQSTYNSIKIQYEKVKEEYDWIISQENLDFSIEDVKPVDSSISTFNSLITRLLELDAVTINESISIAKNTKLIEEENLLLRIRGLINTLTSMYPKITLSDGEGIPYNKGIWIDLNSKFEFNSEDGDNKYDEGFEDPMLMLARDEYGNLYNPSLEYQAGSRNEEGERLILNYPEYASYYPTGFMWNNEGWINLSNVKDRDFNNSFSDLVDTDSESDVTSHYLIMRTYNGDFFRIKFYNWNSYETGKLDEEKNPIYNSYPGSSYKRTQIYQMSI